MRKVLVTIAALIFSGVGLTACFSGNPSGPTVGVAGDSITYLSSADIANQLAPSYAYDIEAYPGVTIGQWDPEIASMVASEHPSHWILNLGSNDAIQASQGNPTDWQTALDTEITTVRYAQCNVLVTINTNADTYGSTDVTTASDINAALQYTADLNPNFIVLDWNYLVHQNPGWLDSGGIHPNAIGQQELADWYGFALSLCP